ncbi:MAG: universal stress protein [Pseudomonadota bacterium]
MIAPAKNTVVAFIDGSAHTAGVCDSAAWAAGRLGAAVALVHTMGRRARSSAPKDYSGALQLGARSTLMDKLAKADAEWAELARARGWAVLEEAQARLYGAGLSDVAIKLRQDDVLDAERDFQPTAALLVVGKRGENSGFASEHLGSNLERLLRASTRPVLIANPEHTPIQRCLFAFDGGPSATKALRLAAKGALLKDVAVHLLRIGDDDAETRAELDGAAALLAQGGLSVKTELHPKGEPDAVILERLEATEADLLIMGAYGHSRIRQLIIGSTTTTVIRACPTPVLMAR